MTVNPNDQQGGVVDLVTLVSSEFGVSSIIATREIRNARIEIDGEVFVGKDKFSVPISRLRGREIAIIGRTIHWKMNYPAASSLP